MYHEGQGIAQDDTQAMDWYRKAAAQGNSDAQSNPGQMESRIATCKAAGQGDAKAQFKRARCMPMAMA